MRREAWLLPQHRRIDIEGRKRDAACLDSFAARIDVSEAHVRVCEYDLVDISRVEE